MGQRKDGLERMKTMLTEESAYRFHERLGIMYGSSKVTPAQHDDVAMAALRWQRKNDPDGVRSVRVETPESPIMHAE
jgi:hypothetical protein